MCIIYFRYNAPKDIKDDKSYNSENHCIFVANKSLSPAHTECELEIVSMGENSHMCAMLLPMSAALNMGKWLLGPNSVAEEGIFCDLTNFTDRVENNKSRLTAGESIAFRIRPSTASKFLQHLFMFYLLLFVSFFNIVIILKC